MCNVFQSLGCLPVHRRKNEIVTEVLNCCVGAFLQYELWVAFVCVDWGEEPVAILEFLEQKRCVHKTSLGGIVSALQIHTLNYFACGGMP